MPSTKAQAAYYALHRRYVVLLYALQAAPLPSEDEALYQRWYVEVRKPALRSAERHGGRVGDDDVMRLMAAEEEAEACGRPIGWRVAEGRNDMTGGT
jgi:hypothetical protein